MYCQWEYFEDGGCFGLQWDGGEKFYGYVEWLKKIVRDIVSLQKGLTLNGVVDFRGESFRDVGHITVVDNVVNVSKGYASEEELDRSSAYRN